MSCPCWEQPRALNKRARHFSSHSCICRLSSRLSPTVRCTTHRVGATACARARALITRIRSVSIYAKSNDLQAASRRDVTRRVFANVKSLPYPSFLENMKTLCSS